MPAARQTAAITLYANLMDECKARIASIDAAINGRLGLPYAICREFGFLQLRMLCELIALSCLVAHGDIKATQEAKLRKQYLADRIIDALDELHSDFYPRPVQIQISPGHAHLADTLRASLTKAELLKLYGRCGSFLHRGRIKDLETTRSPTAMRLARLDYREIYRWSAKIGGLLDQHRIALIGHRAFMICALVDPSRGNRASVAFAEAPPES